MEDNSQIEFQSNVLYGFCSLLSDCIQYGGQAQNVLKGFENKQLAELSALSQSSNFRLKKQLGQIQQQISSGKIEDFSILAETLKENIPAKDLTVIQKAYAAYSDFFEINKNRIQNNVDTLNQSQNLYALELKNIYKCFGISEDKKCPCFVNPFPKNKFIDGISNENGVCMNYSLTREENQDNYIENSDILKRKSSTPFHEATHFCFFNSQIKKDIENGNNLPMKNVLKNLMNIFEQKGKDKAIKASKEELKACAIGVINEGFAACSSALYNEKTQGTPVKNNNEWYHGWKEANDFARQMYPLFKEYVSEGKSFDTEFFNRLNITMAREKMNLNHPEKNIQQQSNANQVETLLLHNTQQYRE